MLKENTNYQIKKIMNWNNNKCILLLFILGWHQNNLKMKLHN